VTTNMSTHSFPWVTTLFPIAVQFVLFLRWLHRRMRNDEMVYACVRDIALTHLPHIYASLEALGKEKGTTLPKTPVIHFVDFNGRRRG
jgi:hypothetical protein